MFILSMLEAERLKARASSPPQSLGCDELDLECFLPAHRVMPSLQLAVLLPEVGGAWPDKVGHWDMVLNGVSYPQLLPLCPLSGHQKVRNLHYHTFLLPPCSA